MVSYGEDSSLMEVTAMAKQRRPATSVVWARLTQEERARLEALARDEDRTVSYIVTRLLRQAMATAA
jgi:hypothetical protein